MNCEILAIFACDDEKQSGILLEAENILIYGWAIRSKLMRIKIIPNLFVLYYKARENLNILFFGE